MIKLKKRILIKEFADSCKAIKKKPLYLAIVPVIDLLFLFVFFIIYNFFFEKIMDRIISNQQQMNSLIINIGFWIFGLVVLSYLLYCIFQGLVWFIAHKVLKEKTNFKEYIKRFFAVNILWCISFIIIAYFYVKAVILTQVLRSPSNLVMVGTFSAILLVVLCYFAFISYALIKKHRFIESIKKSFSLGIKEFSTIIPMYVLLILGFALIDVLLRLLFMISTTLMIVVGIILIFPFIAYARLVIISVVEKLIKT